MANKKKYTGREVLYKTKCVDPTMSVFLRPKWYDVIDEMDDRILIRFNSGGACWYSKDRFRGRYTPH